MTLDEIKKLCQAIDNFDAEDAEAKCRAENEWPICLKCGGEYRVDTGLIPTALDDGCAHDALTDLARTLLLVLPVVRAAEAWADLDNDDGADRCEIIGDQLLAAIDTMRAAPKEQKR